jgi:hypothetical protein
MLPLNSFVRFHFYSYGFTSIGDDLNYETNVLPCSSTNSTCMDAQ